MATAFYVPVSEGSFESTPATAGPWTPDAQHGGPPSALLARAMERFAADGRQRLARVTVDILRPVPVAPLDVRVRVVRPGRRITLLEAIATARGEDVAVARGWRIEAPAAGSEPPAVGGTEAVPPLPSPQPPPEWEGINTEGYISTIEWRFVRGALGELGPGVAWGRVPIPLVAGEGTSPWCRVMTLADSGSGISSALDGQRFLFINVDLTVVLHRPPEGEWILLDSVTEIDPGGVGVARTVLSDQRGRVGHGLQTLLVAHR